MPGSENTSKSQEGDLAIRVALLEQAQSQAEARSAAHYEALTSLTSLVTQAKEVLRGLDGHVADLRQQQREIDKEALPHRVSEVEEDLEGIQKLLSELEKTLVSMTGTLATISTKEEVHDRLAYNISKHVEEFHGPGSGRASGRKELVAVGGAGVGAGAVVAKLVEYLISLLGS